MSKIIILGAGAIGSFYGAMLAEKHDVLLIARKKHADAINKAGLKIEGKVNNVFRVKAAEKVNEIEKGTVILLCCKAYDTKNALNGIKNLLKKDTIVVVVQNGFGGEDIAKKTVKCRVDRAVSTAAAEFLEPGLVRVNSEGELFVKDKYFVEHFRDTRLKVTYTNKLKHYIWKKAIINCVFNPFTAATGFKNEKVADYMPISDIICEECVKVAAREKEFFDEDFKDVIPKMAEATKGQHTSMVQDLRKGRQTEIEFLNGAVVRKGFQYGIETPVNSIIHNLIKVYEKEVGRRAQR